MPWEYKGLSPTITDDLDLLLDALAPHICDPLRMRDDLHELLEVVMDLGRLPEARFPGREVTLSEREVTESDIEYVVARISEGCVHRFGKLRVGAAVAIPVEPIEFADIDVGAPDADVLLIALPDLG